MNSERTTTEYRPIPCASYDLYEIAILHGSRMQLLWQEDNVIHDQVVTPLSLRTAQGQEFLQLRTTHDETLELRLDQIQRATIL